MAAVISEAPLDYTPMHDDLWFKLTSNNSGSTNFKFVVEVIVNGTTQTTVKLFPDVSGHSHRITLNLQAIQFLLHQTINTRLVTQYRQVRK